VVRGGRGDGHDSEEFRRRQGERGGAGEDLEQKTV